MIIFDGLAPRVLVFTTPFKGLILNFAHVSVRRPLSILQKKLPFAKERQFFCG